MEPLVVPSCVVRETGARICDLIYGRRVAATGVNVNWGVGVRVGEGVIVGANVIVGVTVERSGMMIASMLTEPPLTC